MKQKCGFRTQMWISNTNVEIGQKCQNRTEMSKFNKNVKFDHVEMEQKCRYLTKMLRSIMWKKNRNDEIEQNIEMEQKSRNQTKIWTKKCPIRSCGNGTEMSKLNKNVKIQQKC